MDVRCEKCRTEYELDESKLKPGGVTVKCTNCGHMFKVRRRITAIGPAVSGPPTLRGGQPPAASVSPPSPEAPRPAAASANDVPPIEEGERTWLVRLEDGEILTCRELATLQKWIARGQVTRACEISRTGKKWKPLGDIGELSSFFDIADEAREVGPAPAPARAPTAHPHTVPRQPSGSAPAASPVSAASEPPSGPAVRPGAVAPVPEQPSGPARVAPMATDPDPGAATGAWATQGSVPAPVPSGQGSGPSSYGGPSGDGPSGPTHGFARMAGESDAAFTSRVGERKGEFENGSFIPTDDGFDDDLRPPSGGIGRWVALISIVILLGGALALYMILFRDGGGSETAASTEPDAAAAAPAPDAAPEAPADRGQALADAEAALRGDTRAGIENALQVIEPFAADPAATADALMAAARLEAALAQHLLDEAEAAERASRRKQLITQARERADRIEALATRAEEIEPGNAAAMVARADALRLRGRPAREVERWLRRALQKEAGHREALLARALLYARDRRPRQARQVLEDIDPAPGDVRAAYRLARLEVADKSYGAAREKIAEVLAAEPEHAGAAALKEKVTEALAAAEDDDGDDEPAGKDESGGDDGGESDSGGGGGIDSYDRLLARADKLAERGRCEEAKGVYQKALDANPSGVAALTGLGYCYLDSRQFASAHARFRAALGISSRYQSALWGMGELYERQGLKDKAIEAFERFIEAHPTSRRAETARRRIEKLGGKVGGGSEQGSDDEGGEEPGGPGNETGSGADSPGDGSSESSSPPDP